MCVLIDECIDERLRNHLTGHDCQTARYAGFAGLKNGKILDAAEGAKLDVFLIPAKSVRAQRRGHHRQVKVKSFE